MDYNKDYSKCYQKAFKHYEHTIKTDLLLGKKTGQSFTYTSNEMLKALDVELKQILDLWKADPLGQIHNLFESRKSIYNVDPLNNVIQLKILPLAKANNWILDPTLIQQVKTLAKSEALKDATRLFTNQKKLYELQYDTNKLVKFELKQYPSPLKSNRIYQQLFKKLYLEKSTGFHINPTVNHQRDYLTVKEVAIMTNYAVPTIYDKKHKGEIPFHKVGSKLLFKKSEIQEWLENGKGSTMVDVEQKVNEYMFKNS